MTLLEVTNLATEIQTREGVVRPVDGVTFSVDIGETVGLVGESGSGKTMTGMSVLGLLPPGGSIVGGSIKLNGRELRDLSSSEMRRLRGNDIAMIFQDPMSSLNPTRTIGSQLREAYQIHQSSSRSAATRRAVEVLGLVGLPRPSERLEDFPHQLSGGMRQRVMIAIALVCEPKLLIADEPTTALDVSIQAQILELLDELKSRLSMGVLLVTHDLGVIACHSDRVVVMYAGRVAEQASTLELFADPQHRYTAALFESMPTLELDARHTLETIPGTPPRLIDLGSQCRFYPRCAFATEECLNTDPALIRSATGHEHSCLHPNSVGSLELLLHESEIRVRHVSSHGEQSPALLELKDVDRSFAIRSERPFGPRRRVHAVSGVSLAVRGGETLGIVGESGCGKTTIGRMIVGLDRPTEGSVVFQGKDLSTLRFGQMRSIRRDLQIMFQDSAAALDPRMRVSALVEEPLIAQKVGSSQQRRQQVRELLDAVGLPADSGRRYAREFSGGQRQRIAMARALALRPKIIVADEPVSALDVSVQAQILNLMRSLQDQYGLTYVVISHDLSLLKYLADRIGVMYLGKLVELGTSDEVYGASRHPYTAGLLRAIPLPNPALRGPKSSSSLGGELPSAIDPPSGCRFRTRCDRATERCALEEPPLETSTGLHAVACHYPLDTEPPHRTLLVADGVRT